MTATLAKTGRNPGRDKATTAAMAVQGLAVFPMDLPEGGSDFNYMHQAHGLQAVRACVVAAVQAHRQAMQATASASKGDTTPGKKKCVRGPIRALVGMATVKMTVASRWANNLQRCRITDNALASMPGRPLKRLFVAHVQRMQANAIDILPWQAWHALSARQIVLAPAGNPLGLRTHFVCT